MGFLVVIFILSFVAFFIHFYTQKGERSRKRAVELLLLYQLLFNVGFASLFAAMGFLFFQEEVGQALGWPPSPFQHELGNANLAFGVLGILSIWLRGHFWTATVLGLSIWLLGDAWGHIYHIIFHNNLTDGNAGIPLFGDIIVPLVLLVLLFFYLKSHKKKGAL